jgi:hypothetical protein
MHDKQTWEYKAWSYGWWKMDSDLHGVGINESPLLFLIPKVL